MAGLRQSYYRNGASHRAGADVSFSDIVKVFGFRRVRIGRWVTAGETQHAANLFFDAFSDLQQILQVPSSVIALRGTVQLSFGIGGDRSTCAFYEPRSRNLALAKNAGGGSLAHEWFHAFDHYIAPFLFTNVHPSQFASTVVAMHCGPAADANTTAMINHPLNHLLWQALHPNFAPVGSANDGHFSARSRQVDRATGFHYFSKSEELAARAFEAVIAVQPQQNSFLQQSMDQLQKKQGVYPTRAEVQPFAAGWLCYFSALGHALQIKQMQ